MNLQENQWKPAIRWEWNLIKLLCSIRQTKTAWGMALRNYPEINFREEKGLMSNISFLLHENVDGGHASAFVVNAALVEMSIAAPGVNLSLAPAQRRYMVLNRSQVPIIIKSSVSYDGSQTQRFHHYWNQFVWDHSFETTFIWDHDIWDNIHFRVMGALHLKPRSFETAFFWDLFIWDHSLMRLFHLGPRSVEITFIWDHIHLRPHSFETTFIWDHNHLRSQSFHATLKWSCFDLLWTSPPPKIFFSPPCTNVLDII